ncbi:MAG: outer membrane protein assembly factor BamD, partial [Sphingomonadaceae bacterium]|nr:outer membrane protein assembly factor BamD [Sphingomonadaceae bacterium]
MLRSRLFRALALPLLGASLALSGCASTKAKKDRPYVARDVDTLYTAA